MSIMDMNIGDTSSSEKRMCEIVLNVDVVSIRRQVHALDGCIDVCQRCCERENVCYKELRR